MADKRIKDLETLPNISLDGANDYLVVDDSDGNTSKMTVDSLVQNSGPFKNVAQLGPPVMHSAFLGNRSNNNCFLSADIFSYSASVYGQVFFTNMSVTFFKAANSNQMSTVSQPLVGEPRSGNKAHFRGGYTKTIDSVGSTYGVYKGNVNMQDGVACGTSSPGVLTPFEDFRNRAHCFGWKLADVYGIQFGTGGLSLWGSGHRKGGEESLGDFRQPLKYYANVFVMSWPGV